MSFVIEKGIPVPPRRNRTGLKAAILSMDVGDSMFYPTEAKQPTVPLLTAVRNMKDRQFTTRKAPGGARIWRLS